MFSQRKVLVSKEDKINVSSIKKTLPHLEMKPVGLREKEKPADAIVHTETNDLRV